jgi:hypothetical protein
MSAPKPSNDDPPRLTIGQALMIGLILLLGYAMLENGQSLVVLVIAMGAVALVLNRLLALILRWVQRRDSAE